MPLVRVVELLPGEQLRGLALVSRLAAVLERDESQPYAVPGQDARRGEPRSPAGLSRVAPHAPVGIQGLALLQALTPDGTRRLVDSSLIVSRGVPRGVSRSLAGGLRVWIRAWTRGGSWGGFRSPGVHSGRGVHSRDAFRSRSPASHRLPGPHA